MTLLNAAPARTFAAETAANDGLTAYRNHLSQLQAVLADCQKLRTPGACDASRVGADDRVRWDAGGKSEEREIRYDWLRALLFRAGGKSDAPPVQVGLPPAASHSAPSAGLLLVEAQKRLAEDEKQAQGALTNATPVEEQRKLLSAILARREYQNVTKTTLRERLLEWIGNWLDRLFNRLAGIGARAPWIALVLRGLFIAAVCLALVWMLVRMERRARIRLVPDTDPSGNAMSAREWQLWLADARDMAAQGAWREAIHFLYWAVISRLESRHVWPADRARTPREYLRMVPSSDPRKEQLAALTRSFERTWYGGRPANPQEYERAAQVAEELGVK
jgi:hypothetical protein